MNTRKPSPRAARCAETVDLTGSIFDPAGVDPGSNVVPFMPGSGPFRRENPARCPDVLLVELLGLNEEMIHQLRAERQSAAGTTDFITRMIGHHVRAAALLRAQLAAAQSETV